ncbi:hypothetical protein C8A00DRAFT_17694 [Chaetomidium leptoderma]|uniref:Uncharacterized protein n=1 Tax=Chaetomidium leptoderma TaxID=669021 RepID=A0AAN6VHA3_9PEZI|nr:hypothetical protein C8A00DRAFT_17694 [Chaetomidium leptoderma]
MRNKAFSFALATATFLLSSGANAARQCAGSSGGFQHHLGDVRYDSPDPNKVNGLSTIAASLLSGGRTPLYECVGQWPEEWQGWYEGGSNLIWADCIYTGAGLGDDETVSFAVDWKSKTMYLSHTFACSDQKGSKALASGSIKIDFNCTTAEDDSYCVPKSTTAGTRPTLNIDTKLVPAPADGTSACADSSKQYHSWKLLNWLRRITMEPGSSPADPKLVSDTGPSFALESVTSGDTFSCTPSEDSQNGTFVGACQSQSQSAAGDATNTTAAFRFDAKLNMLEISQQWECSDASSFDVVGVGYVQAACGRVFNSDEFTCTSDPVWIGTGVV